MESLKNTSGMDDPQAFGTPMNFSGGMQDQAQAGVYNEKTTETFNQTRPLLRIKVTFEYEENPESKTIFKN